MILTVTMNASVDTRYVLDTFTIDNVNRAMPDKTAGGKGLNVSRVLLQLGDDVLATGLLGGHMGAYVADLMNADGIPNDFVSIEGETRVCINILHEGNQTEILEAGPVVSAEEYKRFLDAFSRMAARASIVVMSGSLPRGLEPSTYAELTACAVHAGARVILDTSGAALDCALAAESKPLLVKPNLFEVNTLLGTNFTAGQIEELHQAIQGDARFVGIEFVVVSMGADGSVAFVGDDVYRATVAPVAVVNATGCGDSSIAGLAHSLAQGDDIQTALRVANTCGALNAMHPKTGHLALEAWNQVYDSIMVTSV